MFDNRFFDYCFSVLDYYYPDFDRHKQLMSVVEAILIAQDPEHADKSCGYPASLLGCDSKRRAIEKLGADFLVWYYKNYTSVIGSTLKDELRALLKDARFFRPQDVCAYLEGLVLFHFQNEYFMNTQRLLKHPMFLKYRTPGIALSLLYRRVCAFQGDMGDADGAKWDAHFQLAIAEVISAYRSRSLSQDVAQRINRYYSMMYNGYTAVYGNLAHLVGNPSGHHNTSVDNCLGQIIMMSYHAWLYNVPVHQFVTEVLFYCCGDDLIWSDRTGLFTPEQISATYKSMGMFLEFTSADPLDRLQLNFVGTRPCDREFEEQVLQMYTYRWSKLRASRFLHKRKGVAIDRLSKLCSICQLMFAHKEVYDIMYAMVHEFVRDSVADGVLSPMDERVAGLLNSIESRCLFRQYYQWEGLFPGPFAFETSPELLAGLKKRY